jgi:hypothetical protein
MKNFNMLLFWISFFFFVVFFASNSITRPQIFFLGKLIWTMGIVYVWIIWMVMWWGLNGMLNWKWWKWYDSDMDDWEGF